MEPNLLLRLQSQLSNLGSTPAWENMWTDVAPLFSPCSFSSNSL